MRSLDAGGVRAYAPAAELASAVAPASNGWTTGAYVLALTLAIGIGACVWAIPLPVTDFTTYLFEFQQESLAETFVKRFFATNYFRPLFFVQWKLQFDLSNGYYLLAFRGVQVLTFVAIALLWTRLLRVRSSARFAAFSIALVALLGLHTIINGLREGPLTAQLGSILAMTLAFGERESGWRDTAAVAVLVYTLFSVELGLLVWVIYVAGYLVGCRGVSLRGIIVATGVVASYFVIRFAILDPAGDDLFTRQIDGGAVGGRPAMVYARNIAASILTVLFSEPRNGVSEIARRVADGVPPWVWINVVTSTLTTILLAWFVAGRLRAWRSLAFTREDRFVLVFAAVLGANATLGFAYTKDVMMSPAGLLYALAAAVALEAAIVRLPNAYLPVRVLTAVVLLVISLGWTLRTVGLTYVLRETAFVRRNEWALGMERFVEHKQLPDDPRATALVYRLRDDALSAQTPNPWLAQPWAERYFDRVF